MAAVATLRSKASEVFSTLTDVVPGAASCKHYATDHPQITLELRAADSVRTLRHYTGCASAPTELVELEKLIDRTEIGRAHVRTQVTNAQLVCRLLLEKKKIYTPKQQNQ